MLVVTPSVVNCIAGKGEGGAQRTGQKAVIVTLLRIRNMSHVCIVLRAAADSACLIS